MLGTFAGLHIGLEGVPHLFQTTAHSDAADWVSRSGQLLGDSPCGLAGPPQRTHWISCRGLFDDGSEPTGKLRVGLLHFLPPAAGLPYTSGSGAQFPTSTQFIQPFSDRDPRHPCHLRQVADAAPSQLQGLLCDEQTCLVLVQSFKNPHPSSLGRSRCRSSDLSVALHYIKHNLQVLFCTDDCLATPNRSTI